jgi:nucleotide-binding universal stress UspA family protein
MSEPRNLEAVSDLPVGVAVDGSDYAQAAADWAAAEALRRGTPLRVLTVVEDEIDEDALELLSDTETWLTKIYSGLVVQRDVLTGDPVRELETASREVATLVVGSRGLGGFAGLALGSVSMHLAARAHCPLVVVPQGHAAASHPGPTVVGVDVHDCVQVLRYALEHAECAGGGLRVVHAWNAYPAHSSTYLSDTDITVWHEQERRARRSVPSQQGDQGAARQPGRSTDRAVARRRPDRGRLASQPAAAARSRSGPARTSDARPVPGRRRAEH